MKPSPIASLLSAFLLVALVGCSRGQQPAPASSGAPGQPAAPAAQGQPAAPAGQAADAATQPSAAAGAQQPGGPAASPAGAGPTFNTAVPAPPAAAAAGTAAAKPYAGGAPAAAPGAPATPSAPAPPPPPRTFTLAEDRPLEVKTVTEVSTKTAKPGDTFRAFLTGPISDGDWTIAPEGAEIVGVVQASDPGGRVKGLASLTVTLQSLQLADGSVVQLKTSSYSKTAKSGAKKDAAKIGIGTAAGAGVGAIVGGGKGAAIGAAVGGGGAAGATLATRGSPAVIAPGAAITFRLKEPVTVTKK